MRDKNSINKKECKIFHLDAKARKNSRSTEFLKAPRQKERHQIPLLFLRTQKGGGLVIPFPPADRGTPISPSRALVVVAACISVKSELRMELGAGERDGNAKRVIHEDVDVVVADAVQVISSAAAIFVVVGGGRGKDFLF